MSGRIAASAAVRAVSGGRKLRTLRAPITLVSISDDSETAFRPYSGLNVA